MTSFLSLRPGDTRSESSISIRPRGVSMAEETLRIAITTKTNHSPSVINTDVGSNIPIVGSNIPLNLTTLNESDQLRTRIDQLTLRYVILYIFNCLFLTTHNTHYYISRVLYDDYPVLIVWNPNSIMATIQTGQCYYRVMIPSCVKQLY